MCFLLYNIEIERRSHTVIVLHFLYTTWNFSLSFSLHILFFFFFIGNCIFILCNLFFFIFMKKKTNLISLLQNCVFFFSLGEHCGFFRGFNICDSRGRAFWSRKWNEFSELYELMRKGAFVVSTSDRLIDQLMLPKNF